MISLTPNINLKNTPGIDNMLRQNGVRSRCICDERDSSGGTVTKRFFSKAEQQGGKNFYYTRDHLGSPRINASGKEKVGTVDLPYTDTGGILDVAGRTMKADGTILELDRKAIYKRDLVRAGGRKEKVVSFAMPGVENGAILEYRWKQMQNDNRFRYLRLEFSRDLPVQKVTYFFKPLSSAYVSTDQMYILPFNCNPTPLQQGKEGWTETTVTDVPAVRDEPYAPSNPNVQPWALLYYRPAGS